MIKGMNDTCILGQKKTQTNNQTYCEYGIARVNLLKNVKSSYCWITAECKYKQ